MNAVFKMKDEREAEDMIKCAERKCTAWRVAKLSLRGVWKCQLHRPPPKRRRFFR